jgi:hypothetical protein
MTETVIPTMCLRFVNKSIPAPELGADVSKNVRVLQQLFRTSKGEEWRDVPFVEQG